MAHKNTQVFHMTSKKQTVQGGVLWMNDSRIHQEMKIARNDSAVKLVCSDWCGLPLNTSEGLSEQALIFLLEG